MTQIDGKNFTQYDNLNLIDELYIRGVPAPYQGSFTEIVISNNYTTTGNEILKLSSNVLITLNTSPEDGERVYIKSATGLPFRVCSSKRIDGNTMINYRTPYVGRWFSYSSELDTWSIL